VAYPVACLPQAWAAGSVFMLLQMSLGIQIDALDQKVEIDRPMLPSGLESMAILDIPFRQGKLDINFERVGTRVLAFADRIPANSEVSINVRL